MNPETNAPSIITKWVETKDFRVRSIRFFYWKEFYPQLSDHELRYYFYKILVV